MISRICRTVSALCFILLCTHATASLFDHQHSRWDQVLKTYVLDNGASSQIRYSQIKENPRLLDAYLGEISSVTRQEFELWSKAQRLAFLVNAYNAFTIKLITQHYPVQSIKDIGSFFSSTWKIEFIKLFGEITYLDFIEHDLIRGAKDYSEPRIHFALVCASVGCPKLQSSAFTESNSAVLFEKAAEDFLHDTTRNYIDVKTQTLQLSPIFKWYGEDFKNKYGSVAAYVAAYLSNDLQVQSDITAGRIDIEFGDYDWSLNDVKN